MKNFFKERLEKYSLLYNIFRKAYIFIYYYIIIRTLSILFKVFPIRNNRIVVCNYLGKGYSDNPKAIVNELLKNNKFEIIWALNSSYWNNNMLPKQIKKVKYQSIKYLYYLTTAKIWIDNTRKSFTSIKRKNQFYIQTWHAGLTEKKVEKDVIDKLEKSYVKNAIKDSKNADLFISNSNWETKLYKKSFWYSGEILEKGLPRNDILINTLNHEIIKQKVYENLGIKSDVNILLYAPTFRKDYNVESYDINIENLINTLEKNTNNKWISLIRLHPNITEKSKSLKYNKKIFDVSNYSDLNELLISAKVLITDYSSLMFEFGYLKKPVYIYASDIDEYISDRGFMFDFNELPFPLSTNNEELIKNILNFNNSKYIKDLKKFYKSVGLNETGESSKEVVKIILKECEINEKK